MTKKLKYGDMKIPLPIPIPLDYDVALGVDRTHLCHVNAGDRQLGEDKCVIVLTLALDDPRLKGLTLLHLRPEMEKFIPFLPGPRAPVRCKRCKKTRGKGKRQNAK